MPWTAEDARRARARIKSEDPERYRRILAEDRARKERYRGTCLVCGKPTSGCRGRAKAPKRCPACAKRAQGLARRGKGPRLDLIVAFVARQEVASWLDITEQTCDGRRGLSSNDLHRLVRSGRLVRVARGRYAVAESERGS